MTRRFGTALFSSLLGLGLSVAPAAADKIANKVAVFTGLDKITGRIITFDVYIDETVQFGALRVTPRVCYTRPATESAQTDGFVEVDEITLDKKIQRIFTGWMFAASPGLNAVEHPVYDIWLHDCRDTSDVPPPGERTGDEARPASAIDLNKPVGEGVEAGAEYGVEMINGIPIPRHKPVAPADGGDVVAPTTPDDGAPVDDTTAPTDGQILD